MGADANASADATARPASDLTPGDHDVPPFSLGGQDMYAISPDGQEVAYTSNIDEVEATSTNNEIFVVPIAGGAPKKISTSLGSDNTPLYSPDGGRIAWRSQSRAGFEADRQNLLVYTRRTGETRNATAHWDRSVGSFVWRPDGAAFYLTAEDHGQSPIWQLVLFDEQPMEYARGLHADDLAVINYTGNEQVFFTRQSIQAPNEIAYFDNTADPSINGPDFPAIQLTHMNDALLSQIDMQPLESFTFKGANNEEVQGFMVKPPGFDPNKKYPLKFLIHGGRKAHGETSGRIAGTRSCSPRPEITWW
jgi:dipeptidyl aminopeptidase/acylaminoacyl peptidase